MADSLQILVVEDSATQALQLRHILEKNGYDVSVATNGRQALDHLATRTPMLVISDVVMPMVDGYELCREIKTDGRTRSVPVILLTQLSEPEDVVKGLECGADNFIVKPYEETFLLDRINYIVENLEIRRNAPPQSSVDVYFAGQRHTLTAERMQILDLLFSTYEAAVQKQRQLERANRELTKALETVKTLRGLIPICARCKKIRDDDGYWQQIEVYVRQHSEAEFSHSMCPDCARALYADLL